MGLESLLLRSIFFARFAAFLLPFRDGRKPRPRIEAENLGIRDREEADIQGFSSVRHRQKVTPR